LFYQRPLLNHKTTFCIVLVR